MPGKKFIGDPAKIHIHIVKANTHLKIAGKSTNFNETTEAGLQKALDTLNAYPEKLNVSGYASCKKWLEDEIAYFS